jgi:hypothetical protein
VPLARASRHIRRNSDVTYVASHDIVELRGLEPLTFWLQTNGAALFAVKYGSLACVRLAAQYGVRPSFDVRWTLLLEFHPIRLRGGQH